MFAIDDFQTVGLLHRDIKTKNFVVSGFTHFLDNNNESESDFDKKGCLNLMI